MKTRGTIGEYLVEAEPLAAIWPDLVQEVFRESPSNAHLENLSPSAQILFEVGMFQGEIINGGVSQFFSNSSGDRSHETLQALKTINAKLSVELLKQAMTSFAESIVPVDREERCEKLFAFEESHPNFFDTIDKVFYERVVPTNSHPEEDLNALQLSFMKAKKLDRVLA